MTGTVLAVAASMVFNLVCSGTEDREGLLNGLRPANERIAPTSEPFREVYRVDLTQRRWCSGSCTLTSGLHSVTAQTITFEYETSSPYRHTFVSRESARYLSTYYPPNAIKAFRYGRCQRATFTGFPKQRF